MRMTDLRRIAEHLEPHKVSIRPHDKDQVIGPEFLSLTSEQVAALDVDPAELAKLPHSVYDGPEKVPVDDGDLTLSWQTRHVFLKSGLDRVLGAGWQQEQGVGV